MSDPWYDYLAIPVAPLVLLIQLVVLGARRSVRVAVNLIGALAIAATTALVWSVPTDPGANIGGALLVMMLVPSVLLLLLSVHGRSSNQSAQVK